MSFVFSFVLMISVFAVWTSISVCSYMLDEALLDIIWKMRAREYFEEEGRSEMLERSNTLSKLTWLKYN